MAQNNPKETSSPSDEKNSPNPVDIHVGSRLRMRRSLVGLSQEKLAEAIGLTFQQVQKYERGTNRISASRLYQLSKILEIPVSYFFDKYGGDEGANLTIGLADNGQSPIDDEEIMQNKETLDLVRVYYSIQDPKLRKDLFKIIKSMAENMRQGSGN